MTSANFDRFLEEQLLDPAFTQRFAAASEAWDVAIQINLPSAPSDCLAPRAAVPH